MGDSPASEHPEVLGIAGRRSTRLNLSVPIVVSGKDTYGQPFRENSRATVMNLHGAKILTFHHLALGAELTLENRAEAVTAKASVVWLGERKFPKDLGEAGIELTEPGNIWGVDIPPEDWQGGKAEAAESSEALAALVAQRKPPGEAAAEGITGAEEGQVPPERIGAAMDEALDRFTKRLQEATELQAQLFEARIAKLTNQIGARLQSSVEAAATGAEEKMGAAAEKHQGNVAERSQATRHEIESLTTTLQEFQRNCRTELETSQRNIQEAGTQAVHAASQQLAERLRQESDATAGKFVEETKARLQAESTSAIENLAQEAQARLGKVAADFAAESEPKLRERQNQAVEQAAAQVNEKAQETATSIIDILQKKADSVVKEFEAQVEKSAQQSQEKVAKEMADHIHKTASGEAQNVLSASSKDLHKAARDANAAAVEEIKAKVLTLAEDAKKRLTALTHATVESLNKEGNAGLDEFRKHLHKTAKDFQDKEGRDLEKHFEAAAHKHREHATKQLQKDFDQSVEQAAAQFRGKVDEASKSAVDAAQKQVADSVRKDGEVLTENLRKEMQKASDTFQEKILAELHAKFRAAMDEQLGEAKSRLTKQAGENLLVISEQLNAKKEKMMAEAEESFRTKLAEAFASMLQPGLKKST